MLSAKLYDGLPETSYSLPQEIIQENLTPHKQPQKPLLKTRNNAKTTIFTCRFHYTNRYQTDGLFFSLQAHRLI
jgi:hypothetical protein